MHYQKRFDKIIDECFDFDELITYIRVKEVYIDRYGTRYAPHGHKISLMLKVSNKVDLVGTQGDLRAYRRKKV